MKTLFQIIQIAIQALAESHHPVADVDPDADARHIKHRAAVGDTTVSISHPLIWDTYKPRTA